MDYNKKVLKVKFAPTIFIILGILCIIVLYAYSENKTNQMKPGDLLSIEDKNLESLVETLQYEGPLDKEIIVLSDTTQYYDVFVGEILRKKDKQSIPLLIKKINSEKPLVWSNAKHQRVYWRYSCPIHLKYKIRFTLERLLGHNLYKEVFKEDKDGRIDIKSALKWYENNRQYLFVNDEKVIKTEYDIEITPYPVFLIRKN